MSGIEAVLFGTAAAGSASSAGVLATVGGLSNAAVGTTGLLGASGSFIPSIAFTNLAAITGATGLVSAGIASKQASDARSELLRRQATRERLIAARDADLFARRQSDLRGNILAGRGASGVALQGTTLLTDNTLRSSALLGEETIRRGGIAKASDLEAQARLTSFKGRAARAKSFTNAGETLLSGFGKAFG